MDATNLAGLLPLLSTAVVVSVAAIVGYVVRLGRHKGDVNVTIRTASGSKISIEGSNISQRQISEILRIIETAEDNSASAALAKQDENAI